MSDAKLALAKLRGSGIHVSVNFSDLLLSPSGRVTSELKQLAVQHKAELIRLLLTSEGTTTAPAEDSGKINIRRGVAAKVTLDDGRSFTLTQPGGNPESIEHVIRRNYGDRVRALEVLPGSFGTLKEHRRSAE
jgi:hypothetical protein